MLEIKCREKYMVELDSRTVLAIVVGSFVSTIFIRVLTFVIKSRCRKIKCACIECERDVIDQNNLRNTVFRDVSLPNLGTSSV